jgi:hypothetical protein
MMTIDMIFSFRDDIRAALGFLPKRRKRPSSNTQDSLQLCSSSVDRCSQAISDDAHRGSLLALQLESKRTIRNESSKPFGLSGCARRQRCHYDR